MDSRDLPARARDARDAGRLSQALTLFSAATGERLFAADAYVEAAALIHDTARGLRGLNELYRRHQQAFGLPRIAPPSPVPDLTEALSYLLKGIQFAPPAQTVYVRLARVAADLDQPQEAMACLRKALTPGAGARTEFLVFGVLLEAAGELELARDCYDRGVQGWPGDLEMSEHLARVSAHRGHRPQPTASDRTFLRVACEQYDGSQREIARIASAAVARLASPAHPSGAAANEPEDAALRAARALRATGAILAALPNYGKAAQGPLDAARIGKSEYYRDHKVVLHEGMFFAIPANIDAFEIADDVVYELVPRGELASRIRELTPRLLRPLGRRIYHMLLQMRGGGDPASAARPARRRPLAGVAAGREFDAVLAEIDRRSPHHSQANRGRRARVAGRRTRQQFQPQASDG